MIEKFKIVSAVAMLIFLCTSMLGVGLSLTLQQIFSPLRNTRLVIAALAANFVVVPLAAVGLGKAFRLEEPFAIGLLLLGLAPRAPFLPKLAAMASGDLAFAVGLMVLLMLGTVVFLPLVLPHLVPGVEVGVWQIARPLALLMLIPLTAGLVINTGSGAIAQRFQPALDWASNASLLTVTVLVVALNLPSVLKAFGTGAMAAGLLFTVFSAAAGYALGGSILATRKVMVLGTSFRNIAAALVVDEQDFRHPRISVMLVISALFGLFLLLPVTRAWGKDSAK